MGLPGPLGSPTDCQGPGGTPQLLKHPWCELMTAVDAMMCILLPSHTSMTVTACDSAISSVAIEGHVWVTAGDGGNIFRISSCICGRFFFTNFFLFPKMHLLVHFFGIFRTFFFGGLTKFSRFLTIFLFPTFF